MNMKKYFSFAIVVFLMAVPLVLTSCGKDNILDDVEELQPELKVWTEPYRGQELYGVFDEAIWSCIGDDDS